MGDAVPSPGTSAAIPGGAYSTLVNFSFLPALLPLGVAETADNVDELSSRASSMDVDSGAEEGIELSQPTSRFAPHGAPSATTGPGQASVPIVHRDDWQRTGAEHLTSSVASPSSLSPRQVTALDLPEGAMDQASLSTTPRAATPTFASSSSTTPGSSRRPFTDVAIPNQWRPSNLAPTRLVMVDDSGNATPAAAAAERGRAQTPEVGASSSQQRAIGIAAARRRGRAQEGYEGFGHTDPRIQGGWSEPVASTAAAYDSDYYYTTSESEEASRSGSRPRPRHAAVLAAAALAKRRNRLARAKKPTYRFQLDPLDSFETWILSLTLQRRLVDGRASGGGGAAGPVAGGGPAISSLSTRQMRWEKRVAEGLDRVFRDWFSTPVQPQYDGIGRAYVRNDEHEQGESALARAQRISTLHFGFTPPSGAGSDVKASGEVLDMEEAGFDDDDDGKNTDDETIPDLRTLEFDGPSCTMSIQPHPNSADRGGTREDTVHPALSSMYSHNYLSSHSLSARYASLSSRVELTFHCESVTINAARLLSTLEDVETDVAIAQARARRNGDHVLAGRSGTDSSSWAYGSGGSRYSSSNSANVVSRSDGVSVVVFGAVRD